MRRVLLLCGIAVATSAAAAPSAQGAGPYKVVKSIEAGGTGSFDYVYADPAGRRLYVPRRSGTGRISVFDLDSLAPTGEISNASARGAAVDPKSGHGFVSSKPVVMFDAKTLAVIKTIPVDGGPDGILFDPFNGRVHIFSHSAPNDTVINAADGSVLGTIDLGGAPEQAASDGKGRIFVDLEDKKMIAVVDAAAMKLITKYDLGPTGGEPAGLGFDVKNHVLFAACASPSVMVALSSDDGKILATLPIGDGTDGGGFNPNTMEAFSSNRDGTLTVVKENSPTSFAVAQTVQTKPGAKTMTIDTKTNQILLITNISGVFNILVVGK